MIFATSLLSECFLSHGNSTSGNSLSWVHVVDLKKYNKRKENEYKRELFSLLWFSCSIIFLPSFFFFKFLVWKCELWSGVCLFVPHLERLKRKKAFYSFFLLYSLWDKKKRLERKGLVNAQLLIISSWYCRALDIGVEKVISICAHVKLNLMIKN